MDIKLKVTNTGIPHIPFQIVNEKNDIVANFFFNEKIFNYVTQLITSETSIHLLKKVLNEVSQIDEHSTISADLMFEITELLLFFDNYCFEKENIINKI